MRFFGFKTIQWQKKWEEYMMIVRRSKIWYIFNTFWNFLIFFLAGILLYFFGVWILYWDFKIHFVEFIVLLFYLIFICFLWFYFWYATYLLITSHRIEKHWVTYLLGDKKEILWYHEITKISYSYPSIIAKIFKYGTLEIMAGDTDKSNILFNLAPKPDVLSSKLKQIKIDYHKQGLDL